MAFQFLGKHKLAVQDYTNALNEDPNEELARLLRAELLLNQNQIPEAVDELSRAINSDRHNHAARHLRALARMQAGDYDGATADIEKAIELDQTRAQYWVLRGDLLGKQSQVGAAIQSYDQAINLDPADFQSLNQRGLALLRVNHALAAISDFTNSLNLNPRQPAIVAHRGTALMRNQQYELANSDFELALTHDAQLIKAYCGRAMCLANLGDYEAALIWLTKQLQRFPAGRSLAELLLTRGKVYYQMARFAPAIGDFSMVIDLERDSKLAVATARCARAVALVQNGQLIRAEKEFLKVLEQVPNHEGARKAYNWLQTGEGKRPGILTPPDQVVRPTRPPVMRTPIVLERTDQPHNGNGAHEKVQQPPFDTWIVRTAEKREYGPISKEMLEDWVREGRIGSDAKLLRSGWPKWRRAIILYPELIGKKPKTYS